MSPGPSSQTQKFLFCERTGETRKAISNGSGDFLFAAIQPGVYTLTIGVDACSGCGHQAISFNSCRNRHCPKCQADSRDRWLQAREKELLPTRCVQVVFTLPR